jgi:hypothetical protein
METNLFKEESKDVLEIDKSFITHLITFNGINYQRQCSVYDILNDVKWFVLGYPEDIPISDGEMLIAEKLFLEQINFQKQTQVMPTSASLSEAPCSDANSTPANSASLFGEIKAPHKYFRQIGSSKDYDILDEEDFQKFLEFRAEARKAGMRDDRSKTTAYVDFRRKYPKTDIAEVLNGFRQRKAERERDLANKEFVPMWKNMSTWINKKCWETDDMDIPENAELSELSPEAQRYMSKSSAEKYLLKLEEIDRIFRETGKRIDISDAEDYILGRKIW